MLNTLKKVSNQFISDIYKIDILRFLIVYMRFLFLFYFLRKKRTFYSENQDVENIIKFKEKKKSYDKYDRIKIDETTLEHNLNYTKDIYNLRRKYHQFLGNKTKSLLSPTESLDFIDRDNAKVLSIGPRNESEIYQIRSFGYKWKNISAIDLQSYSKKILLGDMHKINFEDESFDIILSGWTIAYSNNKKLAYEEIKRVSKKNAVICIGFTYLPENLKYDVNFSDERLISTKQIIDYFEVKPKNIFYNFDSFLINKDETRHSIIVFRLNK